MMPRRLAPQAIDDAAVLAALSKKLAPPLVTLLGSEPEIQYVALRNINLIVQKQPTILAHEVKVTLRALPVIVLGSLHLRVSGCAPCRCSSASTMTPSMSKWRSWRS